MADVLEDALESTMGLKEGCDISCVTCALGDNSWNWGWVINSGRTCRQKTEQMLFAILISEMAGKLKKKKNEMEVFAGFLTGGKGQMKECKD